MKHALVAPPHHPGSTTILWVFLLLSSLGSAQESPAPEAPALPTKESLEERRKLVLDSTTLASDLKNRIAESYRVAIEQLQVANDARTRAERFEKLTREAPELLKTIQQDLATESRPRAPLDPNAELTALDTELKKAEAELEAAQADVSSLSAEQTQRTERRLQLPDLITGARDRLEKLKKDPGMPASPDDPPELQEARLAERQCRRAATELELRSYESELKSYEARGELLPARRQLAARRVATREKFAEAAREIVNTKRADEAKMQAEAAKTAAVLAHPSVAPEALENQELADRRTVLTKAIESTSAARKKADDDLKSLESDFEKLKNRVRAAGLTDELGFLLRREKSRLPDERRYTRGKKERAKTIARTQVALYDIDERLSALDVLESRVNEKLESLDLEGVNVTRDTIERELRSLLDTRREILESLRRDHETHYAELIELRSTERRLAASIVEFREYVDERVLWIPSATPRELLQVGDGALWIASPSSWAEAAAYTLESLRSVWPLAVLIIAAIVLARIIASRLVRLEDKLSQEAAKHRSIDLLLTIRSLLIALFVASLWPVTLLAVVWIVDLGNDAPELAEATLFALRHLAPTIFTLFLVRHLVRDRGLGQSHFGWRPATVRLVRKHLRWLIPVVIPSVLVLGVTSIAQEEEAHKIALGRVALVAALCALTFFVARVLHPQTGIAREEIACHPKGWISRLRRVWYPLILLIPLSLAVLTILGYYYTAKELGGRLLYTLITVLALGLLRALVGRWSLLLRRRIAVDQAKARREALLQAQRAQAAQEAQTGGRGANEGEEPAPAEPQAATEESLDLAEVSAQTQQLTRACFAFAFIVASWAIWIDVLPALAILERVQLGWTKVETSYQTTPGLEITTAGDSTSDVGGERPPGRDVVSREVPVTLADLLLAVAIGALTLVAVRNLPGFLQITILQRTPLDAGARYAFATITSYIVALIGMAFGLRTLGIGWSSVQWLAAALTVGLGFGLQEIFANFVSGIILLVERPIRVGDTVTVGGVSGTVSRIRIRATVIEDWDRKELLVPNREFVTGQVVNWTLTDPINRLVVRVGVAYGSDTSRTREILLEVARKESKVLDEPPPQAFFMGFGDSTLDFELRVFVRAIDQLLPTRHDLNMAIDAAFEEVGIEIAFPQRDLHIRSVPENLLPPTSATDNSAIGSQK